MEQEKRGVEYDYTSIQPKEIALVLVWSTIVVSAVGRAIYSFSAGVDFVSAIVAWTCSSIINVLYGDSALKYCLLTISLLIRLLYRSTHFYLGLAANSVIMYV